MRKLFGLLISVLLLTALTLPQHSPCRQACDAAFDACILHRCDRACR